MCLKGEIFGGIRIGSDENDAEILMRELENCCYCCPQLGKRACHCDESGKSSVVEVLSRLRGPWAIVYWQVTLSGKFLLGLVRV